MSQILISYIMDTNLPVSVCVCYKKKTALGRRPHVGDNNNKF